MLNIFINNINELEQYKLKEKFNLILGPNFYFIKKINIENTTKSKLLSIANSIFENETNIPLKNISYFIVDNTKLLAFDLNKINQIKKNKFLKNIYFLETELKINDNNIIFFNNYYFTKKNNIIIELPKFLINKNLNIPKIKIKDLKTSKNFLKINKNINIIDNVIILITIIITTITAFNYIKLNIKNNNIEKNINIIIKESKLKNSLIQNEYILEEKEENLKKQIQNRIKLYKEFKND